MYKNKIESFDKLFDIVQKLKNENKKIVFANGCFDLLHPGHIDYLNSSKILGDILIVAINSDSSIKKIKGNNRPIFNENERAFLISSLESVDYVIIFEQQTPLFLIKNLLPDVLVKGDDWELKDVVGAKFVIENVGTVERFPHIYNFSTTKIIEKIRNI